MDPLWSPRARPRRATVVAAAALLLAACGPSAEEETEPPSVDEPEPDEPEPDEPEPDEPEPDEPEPDEPQPDEPPEETTPDDDGDGDTRGEDGTPDDLAFTECVADRYTVGYPEDWNTNSTDGLLGPCEIFHPGEIDVPEQPRDRDLDYAVSMYVDEVEFDDRDPDDNLNEILEQRETTIDGRAARVLEYRSTGQALTPEGERSYTWSIDLDGEILVATTSSVGDTDYERDKRILDHMVTEELTIDGSDASSDGGGD
ncbi:MAG: hypothetical protein ACLFS9_03420 [Nitriliruptoraceae bacterium]